MSRTRAEIVHAVPQLAPLSNTELADYLAAFRAAHARAHRVSGCLLSFVAVFVGAAFVIVFLSLAMSLFRAVLALSVFAGAIFLAIALVGVPWFLLRLVLRETARSRLVDFDRALRERIRQHPPICIRCGYGLSGVVPADDRPTVVRCPECAMVCPVDDPGHPPVNSGPADADEQTSRAP